MADLREVSEGVQHIIIIGGGAIGCSAAYFLTRHPAYNRQKHKITLLEARNIAGGASGKAGGCLAAWATPTCLAPLSFQLHADLAAEYDGATHWGYRRAAVYDCEESLSAIGPANIEPPAWLKPHSVRLVKMLGGTSDTGQVHPFLYTSFLADKAKAEGVNIIYGSATAIKYSDGGRAVHSVIYKPRAFNIEAELQTDTVVLAAGPWTPTLLRGVPIAGARSHSVILNVPTKETSPDILFFNRPDPASWFPKLEVYPRPDDTVYICGPTDWRVPLPDSTDQVDVDDDSCQLLIRAGESLSGRFRDQKLLVKQSCYRPVVVATGRDRSVGPLFGFTKVKGLLLAAGHDQWGIQNSAATGKIISELIFDSKAVSADISSLDPNLVM